MRYLTLRRIMKKFLFFGQVKLTNFFGPLVSIDEVLAKISEKPNHMGFEVTNICNANCIFCGYQFLEREKTFLPMDLYKKAIDEFNAFGGGSIGFNPIVGDPLVDPHIVERIEYARSKENIRRIGLFTNGILIKKIGAKFILASGIDEITISIGGFDSKTYSRVFRVDRWNSVYQGVLDLLKENQLRNNKVNVCIALRSDIPIWKSLESSAYKALERYKFVLEFNIRSFDNWGNRINQEKLRGTMRLRKPPKKKETCSILYRVPKILSDGIMTLCGCRDLNGDSELVLGNIKDKSILEMWRDPRVEKIRNGFYLSRYPKICHDCSFYRDLSFFRREKLKFLLLAKDRQKL
jgi:MoaA/NifB/PqqE/SkfB family radical SAM enzyme